MSIGYFQGYKFDSRTVAGLIEVDRETIVPLRITQGSYSNKVGASAGTHKGGGVGDCSTRLMTTSMKNTLIRVLRQNGFAAWIRPNGPSWSEHIHFVMIQPGGRNDQGVLSFEAWKQVKEYYDGLDGLAGDGEDPHAWMNIDPITWEDSHKTSSFPLHSGHSYCTPESDAVHDGTKNAADRTNVLRIQKRHGVGLTGKYGLVTRSKVIAFQIWKRIKPTGRYGRATWDKAFPPS